MGAKSATYANDLLKLIFNKVTIAGIAKDDVPDISSLYVSLHTAAPTGSSQSSNEVAYTGYARVAVSRSVAGWTITANQAKPTVNIAFPIGSGGGETITHFGVGTNISGVGKLLYFGTVTPNITTGNNIVPILDTTSFVEED